MKGISKLFFGIIVASILVIPFKVYAVDETYNGHEGCTYSDISVLKDKVTLVKVSYDVYKSGTEFLIEITATNLQSDFYIVDEFGEKFQYDATKAVPGVDTVNGYYDNQTIAITYYVSANNVCAGEELLTTVVKVPKYNIYYGNEICEGIDPDDLNLCAKWYPTTLSKAEFTSGVNEYKRTVEKAKTIEKTTKEEEEGILGFLGDNYIYILIGIFILAGGLYLGLKIRENKRRVI